jgi:hypothetical protein
MAKSWPNITQKKDAPPDAKAFDGVPGKFEQYFTPNPVRETSRASILGLGPKNL